MTVSDLIHDFVYNYSLTESVRAKSGNVSYKGATLFSYDTPILRRGITDNHWLLNKTKHSVTTTGHQCIASSAVFGNVITYRFSLSKKRNITLMCEDLANILVQVHRARGSRQYHIDRFEKESQNLREYSTYMKCKSLIPKKFKDLIKESNSAELNEQLRSAIVEKILKKKLKDKRQHAEDERLYEKRKIRKQKEGIRKFDSYESKGTYGLPYDRIRYVLNDSSKIETTQKVVCSAQLCRKFLSRVIARDYEFISKHKLDHKYPITICDDPTEVKVGCHTFKIKHLSDVLYEYSNKIRKEEQSI